MQVPRQRLLQDVVDQRALAGAGDAGHADEAAEGKASADVLQVVLLGIDDDKKLPVAGPPGYGDRYAQGAGQIATRGRVGDVGDVVYRPAGDDVAAFAAGTRTKVDQPVGAAHRLLVVLDDDHAVAAVAQLVQGVQQALVVALMQADRRLIQHVSDALQAGADLRRQPDALRLAAGQGVGGAVQGQVFQADVDEETQAHGDFAQYLTCDDHLVGAQRLAAQRSNPTGSVGGG